MTVVYISLREGTEANKEVYNSIEDIRTNVSWVTTVYTILSLLNAGRKPSVVMGNKGKLILIYGFSSINTRSTDLNCEHTTFSFTNEAVQIIQGLSLLFTYHNVTATCDYSSYQEQHNTYIFKYNSDSQTPFCLVPSKRYQKMHGLWVKQNSLWSIITLC